MSEGSGGVSWGSAPDSAPGVSETLFFWAFFGGVPGPLRPLPKNRTCSPPSAKDGTISPGAGTYASRNSAGATRSITARIASRRTNRTPFVHSSAEKTRSPPSSSTASQNARLRRCLDASSASNARCSAFKPATGASVRMWARYQPACP